MADALPMTRYAEAAQMLLAGMRKPDIARAMNTTADNVSAMLAHARRKGLIVHSAPDSIKGVLASLSPETRRWWKANLPAGCTDADMVRALIVDAHQEDILK